MSGPSIGTIKGTIQIDYDGKGILRAEKDVDEFGKKGTSTFRDLDKTGRNLALVGGVIAGGFALATASAVSFEKRMSAVKAVSGATADEMSLLSKKALQLGADTKFSASEAALAIEELAKAGLSVTDILNGAADATVALAAAGEIDLPQAATIASNAMNQFGLSAKDLNKVVDNIAGVANASAIDVGEFGFSLSQVGAVAHLAGQSFEDTATAIGLLGNAGIKGSDAGTSLKTFLSNLVPTTKRAKDAFKELGLNVGKSGNAFIDAAGNYKSLGEISGLLNEATKDLSESQKQVALETIFGSDAIRAASVLAEGGADAFSAMNAAMNKSTAADVAATRMDNAAGSIEQLKGSVETLGISIGSKFTPALQGLVDKVTGAVNKFGELDKTTQELVIGFVAAIGGLALAGAAIIKITNFFVQLKKTILIIKELQAVIKLVSAATKVWAAVQWVLSAAVNSTFLIVIAIIAAVALLAAGIIWLWKNNETFRKIVLAVWGAIKTAIAAVVDWLVHTAWPWIQKVWEGIVTGAKWLWSWIVKIFGWIVAAVKVYIAAFLKVWSWIAPVVKAVFGLIVAIIKTAWSIISAILSVIWLVVRTLFGLWWTTVKTVFGAILAIAKAVWGFIGPYIIAAVQAIWAVIKWVWDAVWTQTKAVFGLVLDIIKAVWGFIGPYVIGALEAIWTAVKWAWDKIWTQTKTVWDIIWGVIKAVWGFIVDTISKAKDRVVAIIDGIKVIVTKVGAFFGQLKAAADGGVGTFITFIKSIPGKILDALGNLGKLLFESGKKIIQGLIDGIKSMFGKLVDTVSEGLAKVRDYLPFSPAKKGPFSGRGWTFYSGEALINDFARGVNKAGSVSLDAVVNTVSGVSGAFTGGPGGSSTAVAPASTINRGSVTTIAQVNVQGVWDFTDPVGTRRMVGTLNDEIIKYQKGYQ